MNEKKTDFFIGKLLDNANIKFTPNGSDIKEIQTAFKTASKKCTGNVGFPEFTAKSKDFILVIEDKANLDKHALYDDKNKLVMSTKAITDFAENGALYYANKIIETTNFKKVFAFGCSGDETHHRIRPIYVTENEYKLLETVENFENFSEINIEKYYKEQVCGETAIETLELEEILKSASKLHEILRNYGQLGDSEKPLVVSGILLALSEKSFSIDALKGDNLKKDGEIVYDAIKTHMDRVEVQPETKKSLILNQFNLIKDRPLLNRKDDNLSKGKNRKLAKTPIKCFTEYLNNKVMEFISVNSSEDILGRFYGEFIRYSGGDGQTLGVVLTPNHITELLCELADIKPNDIIFDPCCGTGGFLIAAMNKMIEQTEDERVIDRIKRNQIHGFEIREDMFSIATTNMILRGDGKSNLICDNFLERSADDLKNKGFTVGLMNPPYSQAKNKDTAHLSEIRFIKHLLDSITDNGRCAVIIPQSTMVGKTKEDKRVKAQILESHTLEGVITLNKDTFYGIGVNPCIAMFTAHVPHPKGKYCKFINFEDDGFVIRKHIGLVETERAKEKRAHLIDCWIHDAPAETKFMVKSTVDSNDEWLHSFYYFNDEIPTEKDFEKTMVDYLTFEFNMVTSGRSYLFNGFGGDDGE